MLSVVTGLGLLVSAFDQQIADSRFDLCVIEHNKDDTHGLARTLEFFVLVQPITNVLKGRVVVSVGRSSVTEVRKENTAAAVLKIGSFQIS